MAMGLGAEVEASRLGNSAYRLLQLLLLLLLLPLLLLIVCWIWSRSVCGATCLPNFITTWQTVVAFVVGSSRVEFCCFVC